LAKNAIPRTWTLVIGEDSRRYSDAPNDLIPPSAPIISLTATLTDTSIGVKVSTPSVDTRHVVLSYVFEYNTGSGPFTALTPVGAAVAEVELLIENLQPSTTYFIRARGIDSSIALNQSANSNTISATTDAPAAPGATFWPNWPIMNAQTLQGSNLLNLTNTPVDVLADKDVVIFQSFFPTEARVGPRSAAIDDVHADQSAPQVTRFFLYYLMESTDKVDTSTPGNNAREITRTVITSATDGNPNWFLHRAGLPTSVVEMSFDPTNIRACNMAVLDSGLNSFGENYAEAYWRVWKASWDALPSGPAFKAKLAGVFVDNFNQRGQQNTINNGATPVNDIDFDGDGDVDARGDYSAGDNAGGRMIAEGHLEVKSVIESTYPGYIVIPNAARWDSDYTSGDGLGIPPLPISLAPFFRNFEIILNEHTGNDLSLFTSGTTSYNSLSTAGSTGRIQAYFKAYHIMEKYLKLDATLPAGIGRGCVLQHANALRRRRMISHSSVFCRCCRCSSSALLSACRVVAFVLSHWMRLLSTLAHRIFCALWGRCLRRRWPLRSAQRILALVSLVFGGLALQTES
jgi:hypothetical protein